MTLSPLKGSASNTLHCGDSQDTNNRTVESLQLHMTHSQMLGKVESGGGPIFKVVLEC